MSRKILGLDIRSGVVAAVLATSSIKGIRIESHKAVPVETGGESGLESAISDAIAEMNLADTVCMVSLPADRVSFRNLQLPFQEPKKIKQILPFELEPLLPFAIDSLETDFQTLRVQNEAGNAGILVAAFQKGDLDHLRSLLRGFQLEPQSITFGGYQTAQFLASRKTAPQQSLLLDVDDRYCSIFGIQSGQVCLVRIIGLQSREDRKASMIHSGIRRTLTAAAEMMHMEFTPEEVHLSGRGVQDPGMVEELRRLLDLPVRPLDLVRTEGLSMLEASGDGWQPELFDHAFSQVLAEIEGIRGLNFSRRSFTAKKHWITYRKYILQSAVLAGVVALMALANIVFDFYVMGKQIDSLDQRIHTIFKAAFPEITRIVDPLQQMRVKIREVQGESLLGGEGERSVRSIDILNDISRLISSSVDVDLNQLVVGPDNVLLSGNTATFNMVDDIKSGLEKGELFSKVTITSATADRTGKRINFKIKILM